MRSVLPQRLVCASEEILDKDHEGMKGFYIEFEYDMGKGYMRNMQPKDLRVLVQFESVKVWCKRQDWKSIWEVVE